MKKNIKLLRSLCLVFVTITEVLFPLETWEVCGQDNSDSCDYNTDVVCEDGYYKSCWVNNGNPGNLLIFNEKLIFSVTRGCQNIASITMCELDDTGNLEVIFERPMKYSNDNLLGIQYGVESIIIDNILYFFIAGQYSEESGFTFHLYKYDGSDPVQLIFSAEGHSSGPLLEYNQKLYFSYLDASTDKPKLYSYDVDALLKEIGDAEIFLDYAVYNDKLYFFQVPEDFVVQLWCYDENADQNPIQVGNDYVFAEHFLIFQEKLFYVAEDNVNGQGQQVWMIDGESEPDIVSDFPKSECIEGTLFSSWISSKGVVNDKGLYAVNELISCETPAVLGYWEYDGVSWSKLESVDSYEFRATGMMFNDHYCYGGATGLWEYDGVNPPVKIFDTGGTTIIIGIDAYNNKLFFHAGHQIFVYDSISVPEVVEIYSETSSVPGYYGPIIGFNDDYFFSPASEYGQELWKIDNTGQVSLVEDFYPGTTCYCLYDENQWSNDSDDGDGGGHGGGGGCFISNLF